MSKSPLPSFKLEKPKESLKKKPLDWEHLARKQDAITLHLQLCVGKWDFRHSWEYWGDFEVESTANEDEKATRKLYLRTQRAFCKESPYRLVAEHKTTEKKIS